MTNESRGQQKRDYQPPRMTVISLRPEEAVLGNCKTSTSAGPVSPSCQGGGGGACHGHGS